MEAPESPIAKKDDIFVRIGDGHQVPVNKWQIGNTQHEPDLWTKHDAATALSSSAVAFEIRSGDS
jgi:hypothetical protein